MENTLSIKKMLLGNQIFVPSYQRGYSWELPLKKNLLKTQITTLIDDLEDCFKEYKVANYYFGHFLFEEKPNNSYAIIDGQQRLTTVIIFLSALFERLSSVRELTQHEIKLFKIFIKDGTSYTFSTVGSDNQDFRDYVINKIKKDKPELDSSASIKRIVSTFHYFRFFLSDTNEDYLTKMLYTICRSDATTYCVKNEFEAIQLYNRKQKYEKLYSYRF